MVMEKKPSSVGGNKTGISLSPIDSQKLIEGAEKAKPTSQGNSESLRDVASDYVKEGMPVGTMPPPTTPQGAINTAVDSVKGHRPTLLLDKLGERLAFERSGTRLYEAMIRKAEASENGAAILADLRHIRDEELRHFALLQQVIKKLGGDPTAETPCADVTGVASMGLLQVVGDPRTTMSQSLEALLIAELTDNAAWELLIQLCDEMGHKDLIEPFTKALNEEAEHLSMIRRLVKKLLLEQSKLLS